MAATANAVMAIRQTGSDEIDTPDVCVAHDIITYRMGILLQVRDVPDDVHRVLKARAAMAGLSLSEYVRDVLERDASRPTPAELAARIKARGSAQVAPSETVVRSLREHGE
jgi:plasmid stability protein